MELPEEQHNIEIQQNLKSWQNKPLLQKIYFNFYSLIAAQLNREITGKIVELGSGIGNMKMVVPEVICTDLFPNPWIDQVENAYNLSFDDNSVSNLILFDVWHHLKFPGDALKEFKRVLMPGGHVIIFDPAISLTGAVVYGLMHHEPVAFFKKIKWLSTDKEANDKKIYYAAQGNATRVFFSSHYKENLTEWKIVNKKRMSSFSYVLSGGYSKKQLYPDKFASCMMKVDKLFDLVPVLFATRLLVVLEKK
jgi:SAM-dependent methyltransferase